METLHIAVVSRDADYNRAFSVSLLSVCRQIEVSTFLTEQFVLQWADYQGRGAFYDQFDIILWSGEEMRESYGDNIVFLADRVSLISKDYINSRFSIYKYSPAGTIVSELFDIYAHLTGRKFPLVRRDDVSIFAFASYFGGSGCTTLTRSVCQELVRFYGKRVFCISLEDVESTGQYMSVSEEVRTEGEYLYKLLGKDSRPLLEPYISKDRFGVYSFAPARGKNPLRELSKEDMQKTLSALVGSGTFDVIAADLSTCLTDASVAVMEAADRICVIRGASGSEQRKHSYQNYLFSVCGSDLRRKTIRVANMSDGNNTGTEADIIIRKVTGYQGPDPSAPLEGEFGADISRLTEMVHDFSD